MNVRKNKQLVFVFIRVKRSMCRKKKSHEVEAITLKCSAVYKKEKESSCDSHS